MEEMWIKYEINKLFLPAAIRENITKILFNILTIADDDDWSYDVLWLGNDKQWLFFFFFNLVQYNSFISNAFQLISRDIFHCNPFHFSQMNEMSCIPLQLHTNLANSNQNVIISVVDKPKIYYLLIPYWICSYHIIFWKMEKLLDSTQLVSGVAILLSFIAGYRYGVRNLDEETKSAEKDSKERERVSVCNLNS